MHLDLWSCAIANRSVQGIRVPKKARHRRMPSTHRTRTARRAGDDEGRHRNRAVKPGVVRATNTPADCGELLEVQGFDLMAEIEAMLRHAREFQREVQRLRGLLGKGQTATSDLRPVDAIRQQLDELDRAHTSFRDTLGDVRGVIEHIQVHTARD